MHLLMRALAPAFRTCDSAKQIRVARTLRGLTIFREELATAELHARACLCTTNAAGLLPLPMCGYQPFSHVPVTRFRHCLSWPDLAEVG